MPSEIINGRETEGPVRMKRNMESNVTSNSWSAALSSRVSEILQVLVDCPKCERQVDVEMSIHLSTSKRFIKFTPG